MSEKAKYLETAKATVDKMNTIWVNVFPDFLHPDVSAFKAGLTVGRPPRKYRKPKMYTGLTNEFSAAVESFYESISPPSSSYSDPETGKTYLSESLFSRSGMPLNYFIAYQVGHLHNMEAVRVNADKFDAEEWGQTEIFLQQVCRTIPNKERLYLIRRGFGRKLYLNDGTEEGQLIAGFPPKGGLLNLDQINELDAIYPAGFSLVTLTLLNREGDFNKFVSEFREGNLTINDFLPDSLNFSLRFYQVMSSMEDIPWPIFDSLLTGDTKEAERFLHGALKQNVNINILNFLLDGLSLDEQNVKAFELSLSLIQSRLREIAKYWDLKKN